MWEKQEKHMGLHPDNRVWLPRAPGHRVTALDVSCSFQAPPACAVALGFPEYKPLLSFSLTCSHSWENVGQPLALPSLCRICKWKWNSYFSHSQDGCEDPLKKLVRKSSEMITRVSDTDITLLTHPSKTHLGQLPWVTRWGGPGVVSMGCRFWFWEDPEQPVLTQTGILTSHLSSFLVKISISSSYCPQVILATLSIVKLACKIQT